MQNLKINSQELTPAAARRIYDGEQFNYYRSSARAITTITQSSHAQRNLAPDAAQVSTRTTRNARSLE